MGVFNYLSNYLILIILIEKVQVLKKIFSCLEYLQSCLIDCLVVYFILIEINLK